MSRARMTAANHVKRNIVPSGTVPASQPPPSQFYFAGGTCPWPIPERLQRRFIQKDQQFAYNFNGVSGRLGTDRASATMANPAPDQMGARARLMDFVSVEAHRQAQFCLAVSASSRRRCHICTVRPGSEN